MLRSETGRTHLRRRCSRWGARCDSSGPALWSIGLRDNLPKMLVSFQAHFGTHHTCIHFEEILPGLDRILSFTTFLLNQCTPIQRKRSLFVGLCQRFECFYFKECAAEFLL